MSLVSVNSVALVELGDNGLDYDVTMEYCWKRSRMAYTDWGKDFWRDVALEVKRLMDNFNKMNKK